ncbi:hypothetical protein [Guggenheimella bovis]
MIKKIRENPILIYKIVCLLLAFALVLSVVGIFTSMNRISALKKDVHSRIRVQFNFSKGDIKKPMTLRIILIDTDGKERVLKEKTYGPDEQYASFSEFLIRDGGVLFLIQGEVDGVRIKDGYVSTVNPDFMCYSFNLKEQNGKYYWEERMSKEKLDE